MTLLQVTVLALIQGLTEFLPVSSSAHLIFPGRLLGWEDQGLAFDVAIHVGTLLAVIFYYMADLVQIATHVVESTLTRHLTPDGKVGFCLLLATVPVGLAGACFEQEIETYARSVKVLAVTTIVFGLLLGLSSYVNRHLVWRTVLGIQGERADSLRHLTFAQAAVIGAAQVLALIPGTSRSGITLTAGLFLGLRPPAAARFSFLLAIPVIAASGLLEGWHLLSAPTGTVDFVQLSVGMIIAFFTALTVIHVFMSYISKSGMAAFVIYRVLLGALLLWVF